MSENEKMKLFNLTDVPTPELERRHIINATLAVGQHLVPPGDSIEVDKTPDLVKAVASYVEVGAMAMDSLPAAYTAAKDRVTRSAPARTPDMEQPKEDRKKRS